MSAQPKKPRAAPARKSQAAKEENVEKPVGPRKVEEKKPRGAAPRAFVSSRHEGIMVTRNGRGFSLGELQGAAFPLRFTRMWHVPLDLRRRSMLAANVEALKKWHVPAPKAAAPKATKEAEKPKPPEERKEKKGPKPKTRKEAPKKRAPRKKPKS